MANLSILRESEGTFFHGTDWNFLVECNKQAYSTENF